MNHGVILLFSIAFVLFAMQSVGTWFQLQDYQKAMRRLRGKGTVGVGQKKGFAGHLVIIACDADGYITGAEVMEGMTILSRFRPWTSLEGRSFAGSHINDFLSDFDQYDKTKRKFYKAFIQAVEALQKRFYPEAYAERVSVREAEAEAARENRRVKLPVELMFGSKKK